MAVVGAPGVGSREEIVEGVRSGRTRAAARAISMIENDDPAVEEIIRDLYPLTGNSYVVGFTGPPGSRQEFPGRRHRLRDPARGQTSGHHRGRPQ